MDGFKQEMTLLSLEVSFLCKCMLEKSIKRMREGRKEMALLPRQSTAYLYARIVYSLLTNYHVHFE